MSPVSLVTTLGSALGGGGLVAGVSWWQARKLIPVQRQELKATAEKAAIDIVETALRVAQQRIESMESEIRKLTGKIDELRHVMESATAERDTLQRQLDLTLAQRAELQQHLIELTRVVGERRDLSAMLNARMADAILIVNLESEGTISYASDGVYSLLGHVPAELLGQPLGMLLPEELRDVHARHRLGFAKDPHEREMGKGLPLFARTRDGGRIAVDISLHPTGDGRVIALVKRPSEPGSSEQSVTAKAESGR